MYFDEIDFIKAIAIISVILLHTIPSDKLLLILAPFHIWHAVPVFIMIAGINSTLSINRRGEFNFYSEYSFNRITKYIQRLLLSYSIIWSFEIVVLIIQNNASFPKLISSYIMGGFGPGSYFTPLFVQHLILFPLIIFIKNSLQNKFKINDRLILFLFFSFSIFLEYFCIYLDVSSDLYRLLYVRYLFSAILGHYLVCNILDKKILVFGSLFSFFYILVVSYFKVRFSVIYPAWGFQHAPAFFYTILIIYFLWLFYSRLQKMGPSFLPIGKASYHIFLCQMMWFWKPAHVVLNLLKNTIDNKGCIAILYLGINLVVCLLTGLFFLNFNKLYFRHGENKMLTKRSS